MLHPAEMFYAEAHSGYQHLVTVGVSEHFNSAVNPQFAEFMDMWRTFTRLRPRAPIAVFEGDIPTLHCSNSPLQTDEDVALCVGGDLGLLRTLAYTIGADVETGEPQSHRDLHDLLLLTDSAQIDPSTVASYYWARHAPDWANPNPQPIENEDAQTIDILLRDVRDLHLGQKIVQLWNEGRSPFVLYRRDRLESGPVQHCLEEARLPNYRTSNSLPLISDTLTA
jgi:hypothetical protein